MEKKPKLFIHIGTHKTGSTSIQTFLFQNQKILRENGFLTPKPFFLSDIMGFDDQLVLKYHTIEEELIYDYITNDKLRFYNRNIEYYENKLILKIQKQLLSKNQNVILSEESFFDYHNRRFTKRLDILKKMIEPYKEKFEVIIVVYFRHQDSFIESMYSTYSILNYYSLDFQSYFRQFPIISECDGNQDVSINWKNKIDIIKQILPESEIIVRSFEQASKNGLINDFKSILGISELELKPLSELKNTGLNKHGMNIMINAGFLERDDRELLFRAIWTDETFKKTHIGEKYHLLTWQQRFLIYKNFYPSNKEIFKFSDEQMEFYFYPKGKNDNITNNVVFDNELLQYLIRKIVALQKKTLIFKFINFRRKIINKLPPTIQFAIDRFFSPFWIILCKFYWVFFPK
jgi:hypothetical protein